MCQKNAFTAPLVAVIAIVVAAAPSTPALADVSEAANCAFPAELKFERVSTQLGTVMARAVRYPGETTLTPRYKNVNLHAQSHPNHFQSCSPGSQGKTVQKVTFNLQTHNFFSTGSGDHIAFGLRAQWFGATSAPLVNNQSIRYLTRGIIFRRAPWADQTAGVSGEMFDNYLTLPNYNRVEPFSPPETLLDDTLYSVEISVGPTSVTYKVFPTFVWGPVFIPTYTWSETLPGPVSLNGTGFGVVILCADSPVSNFICDAPGLNTPGDLSMSIHFTNMAMTWQ
ncbi:hypothetical protein WMF38_19855 [Sorangium sp. So ce118]